MPTPTSLGKAATLGPRPRPARGQIGSPGGLVEALDPGWPPGPSRVRGEMTASSLSGLAPSRGGPAAAHAIALADRLRELSALDLDGLRLQWRNVFGRNAPAHLTKPLLSRILAYRPRRTRMAISIPTSVEPSRVFANRRKLAQISRVRSAPRGGSSQRSTS